MRFRSCDPTLRFVGICQELLCDCRTCPRHSLIALLGVANALQRQDKSR